MNRFIEYFYLAFFWISVATVVGMFGTVVVLNFVRKEGSAIIGFAAVILCACYFSSLFVMARLR